MAAWYLLGGPRPEATLGRGAGEERASAAATTTSPGQSKPVPTRKQLREDKVGGATDASRFEYDTSMYLKALN